MNGRQLASIWTLHCKDKMPKIWNKYSQKRNIGASVPISTFMCLWANYIFSRWVCLFCWRKYVDRSWEYINRSQTLECGNWGWGRVIPRKGIYKRNCRCSVCKHEISPLFCVSQNTLWRDSPVDPKKTYLYRIEWAKNISCCSPFNMFCCDTPLPSHSRASLHKDSPYSLSIALPSRPPLQTRWVSNLNLTHNCVGLAKSDLRERVGGRNGVHCQIGYLVSATIPWPNLGPVQPTISAKTNVILLLNL